MTIEVWRRRSNMPFSAYTKVGDSLTPYLGGKPPYQRTYARWGEALIKGQIPISGQLAGDVLGLERVPCPYVGKEPVSGLKDLSYLYRRLLVSIDSGDIVRHYDSCGACGFSALEAGTHPERTILTATRTKQITDAVWDGKSLTVRNNPGTLVVWVTGWDSLLGGAEKAALRHFPMATVVARYWHSLMLQVDAT